MLTRNEMFAFNTDTVTYIKDSLPALSWDASCRRWHKSKQTLQV